MIHKIKISIPEPCHENWMEMSPVEKGRFCASCQKNVIDFTKSSDKEIIMAFNENDKLCGRFKESQINRNLVIQKEKKSIWVIAAASIIAFLGLGTQTAKAQGNIRVEQTDKKPTETNFSNNEKEEIEIEGKIFLDETNSNFEEVDIFIDGKNPVFHPDSEGKFCIKANRNAIISIYKDGYMNYSTKIYNFYLGAIELEKENCKKESFIVGGAVAVKRSFWYRLFHKN